ncbi:MAG: serine/threonine-protein kinase [Myxococcota bacterium]
MPGSDVVQTIAMRICPSCNERTEERFCRNDGYRTVDAARFDEAKADPLVGKVFEERYIVEELIGKGGFGAVYRGRQIAVDRVVAIKVLRSELCENVQVLARFQQEARAVAALKHPNIIEVYDFGQAADGGLYLVMEFLEGEPLDKRMRRAGPMDVAEVVEIGRQTLDALADAHAVGIIHRDLKPENLFVATQGRGREVLKVLDFGIAKVADNAAAGMTLTGTGMAIGSPRYMSPEQCAAVPVVPQSDLYSLGLILYEALSGKPTFDAATPVAYMMAHVNQVPPPPAPYGDPLHGPLIDLVMQCIAKQPGARPQSADAALAALNACRHKPLAEAERTLAVHVDGHAATSPALAANTIAVSGVRSPPPDLALRRPSGPTPVGRAGATLHAASVPTASPASFDTGHADSALPSAEFSTDSGLPKWAIGAAVAAALLLAVGGGWWALSPSGAEPEAPMAAALTPEAEAAEAGLGEPVPEPEPEPEPVELPPEPAPEPAAVAAPEPAAVEVVEPPPAPEPTQFGLTVKSDPPGATVTRDGKELGETPFVLTWTTEEAPPVLVLSRRGYADLEVTLGPDDVGADTVYQLERKSSGGRAPTVAAPKPAPVVVPEKPAPRVGFKPVPVSEKDAPKPSKPGFDMVE